MRNKLNGFKTTFSFLLRETTPLTAADALSCQANGSLTFK